MKRGEWFVGGAASLALVLGAWLRLLPLSVSEVLGFVTGAACVWLTVREDVWNWPVGLANDVFFIVLFWQARLFADMGLQVVYVVLGALGWYWWLHGGERRRELRVARAAPATLAILAAAVALGAWGLTLFLRQAQDAAPFWDALTTALSLAAQYLLTRKLLENWHVWIAADVLYIGLYAYKGLYLTAGLYAIFLVMCVTGLRQWRRSLAAREAAPGPALAGTAG